MTDPERFDRLLHDVVRDRAGEPLAPPSDEVLAGLRARGADRRRRRSRRVAVAAAFVAVVGGGLVGLAYLPDSGADRVSVVDEPTTVTSAPSTTTTSVPPTTDPPTSTTVVPDGDGTGAGPAIGAPAEDYVGLVFETHADDQQLWTADGRSLDYLAVGTAVDLGASGTVVTVVDGDRTMLWLLATGGTRGSGTVVDAVAVPSEAVDVDTGLGAGCTSTATAAPVVGVVRRSSTGGGVAVLQVWTVEQAASGAALVPQPSAEGVSCTGLASEG